MFTAHKGRATVVDLNRVYFLRTVFGEAGNVEAVHTAQRGLMEGEYAQIPSFAQRFIPATKLAGCNGEALCMGMTV